MSVSHLAITTFFVLLGFVVAQGILVLNFVVALTRWRREQLTDDQCPAAAIILCLRGADPFLKECIVALLNQDYPSYKLHVIIDHPDDSASCVVDEIQNAQDAGDRMVVHYLEQPLNTCSLKCSSLIQVINSLDNDCKIVAQVDADTVAHPSCLRELVAPLQNEDVAVSTGNRWYMPNEPTMGSLMRYVWNAGAVVWMYGCSIGWGGTLAMKIEVVRSSNVLDAWSKAFAEDVLLYRHIKNHGYRQVFVPSLMMPNRERCNTSGFFEWGRRQLIVVRLEHPSWVLTILQGVLTFAASITALVLTIWACFTNNLVVLGWSAAGFIGYQIFVALLIAPTEVLCRQMIRSRGENANWIEFRTLLKIILAIPLAQSVHTCALLSAICARRVQWRGISYRIHGQSHIQMEAYTPYEVTGDKDSIDSI